MIRIQDPLGKTVLTNDFFVGLVSNAIKNCYGVAGMSSPEPPGQCGKPCFRALINRQRR